jgi:DNA-directed RNA polymerase beta' subunit
LGHAKNRVAATEEIMSGQSGQLIVQNMGMEALNRTLFQKELPKVNDRAAMFPKGFGRHATEPEWIWQKRALEDETRQKEVDKAQRKVKKASKKVRKVELEERWKAVCVAHEEAVVNWNT